MVRLSVGHQHSQFWPILARFMDYYSPFCDPKAISMVVKPQGVLTCWSTRLAVWADCGPFCGLLLTVFGTRVISTIDEPRGAYMCRSSTLAVFGDSDLFHGLLITILESQSDFHGCRIPRSAYVLVVRTRSVGRF